jgi:hypothetical protein
VHWGANHRFLVGQRLGENIPIREIQHGGTFSQEGWKAQGIGIGGSQGTAERAEIKTDGMKPDCMNDFEGIKENGIYRMETLHAMMEV